MLFRRLKYIFFNTAFWWLLILLQILHTNNLIDYRPVLFVLSIFWYAIVLNVTPKIVVRILILLKMNELLEIKNIRQYI